MIKMSYTQKPFYTDCGMNQPCDKDLSITFDEDASSNEIIAEVIKVLTYAGYSKPTRSYALNVIDQLVDEGIIEDDTEEDTELLDDYLYND